MLIDITLKITRKMVEAAGDNDKIALSGHIGTHFDVMDKEFPLEYTKRKAIAFDVSKITDRDIDICDIDLEKVESGMFVAFYTGFIERVEYGSRQYFKEHPTLSHPLIDALLDKDVSIIGIDFAGVRRGTEHTPKDQYCADRGAFIIENLCGLNKLTRLGGFWINTYPMSYADMSGLPCRVIAEI